MRKRLLSWLTVLALLFAMIPMQAYAEAAAGPPEGISESAAISIAEIKGITLPVIGDTPVSAAKETEEYTAAVSWNGDPETFAADQVYTATIIISPKQGYTLTGVNENFFKIEGAEASNKAESGTVTAVFPKTAAGEPITESSDEAGKSINALFVTLLTVTDAAIAIPSIDGITVPVKGETPDTTADETAEYTASITWIGNPTVFAASTAYSAEITITPKTGYTLTGVTENFFTVAGAAATNPADSGVVTAVFPITGPDVPQLINAKTSKTGDIVTLEFDKAMADPSADAGSFAVKVHGNQGSYYSDTPKLWTITPSTAAINADPAKVDLLLGESIQRGDVVTVDYTPGTVAAADSTSLGAIKNFPVTNNVPVEIVSNLKGTWQAFDHVGNWNEADFPNDGDDPRGKAFNRHIVIDGSEVIFFGNGVRPFKDFLYMPNAETTAKSFTFNLDLSGINYHSMEGGGFLFNTEIDGGLLYGYCALFTIDQSYSLYSQGQNYAVNLYQIDGVDVMNFHDGVSYGSNNSKLDKMTGIKNLGPYPLPNSEDNVHSIMLEASSNTIDLWDGSSKIIDSSNAKLPEVYGNGVGIIASYFSHDCSMLSYFKFKDLKIQGIANLEAVLNGDQANLTFTAPAGATSVIVQQSTDGAIFTDSAILNPPIGENDTTATVTGLAKKQSYYFRLLITSGKYDGYSRIATAAYTGLINDLRATSGDGQAYLTFSAPEGAEGVAVMQSTDGGINFTPAAITGEVNASSTSATVTGLINGQEYKFKLVISGGVHAGDSNIAATTPNVKQDSSRSGGSSKKVEKIINKLRFEIADTDCYLTSGSAIETVIPMDVAPIIYEDRTLLPIRYVVEPLGGTALWNQAEQKATVTLGKTTVELWLGKSTATVNGVEKMIDPLNSKVVPILIEPGRVMLPLRFIAESLGCTVDWNELNKNVTVKDW